METFLVAKFTCTYDEWKSVYDGDLELRKQFMKDDIVGKVDENTAMIKATITNPEKMEKIMSLSISMTDPKTASPYNKNPKVSTVYKILQEFEWSEFEKKGYFDGSKADKNDGFIHLATYQQVDSIIKKYFSHESLLYILEFSFSDFLDQLK